jgi:CPA2 family monovalent cation:H+ antiporter-2
MVVLAVSLAVVCLLRRLRVPPVVGFLLAGAVVGPGGLGLAHDREGIGALAEIGVVLLLFTIGLKFSLQEIARLKVWVFGAGTAQVMLTLGAVMLLARWLGLPTATGVFFGFLVALSSTAIVLKLQEQAGESGTPYGRLSLSILILQDIAVVPLLLLVPMLGQPDSDWLKVVLGLGRSLLIVAAILLATAVVLPRLIEAVVRTRSPEIFTLTIILIALGTAMVAGQAGLSLALGAFLAGVVLGGTPYSHHVTAQIMPLRDAFSSLFFVSIGMLVEPRLWVQEPFRTFGLMLGIVLLKALVVTAVGMFFRAGGRASVAAGLSLAQVGEFSFVLAQAGMTHQLLDQETYQTFLSISVLTMAVTPLLVALGRRLSRRSSALDRVQSRLRGVLTGSTGAPPEEEEELRDHVVLVGYGVNGRQVAQAMDRLGVACVVLELNPATAEELRTQGRRVIYGDACQESLLHQASLETARAMVVSIADPVATRCITAIARSVNPRLDIIVRTRFVAEVETLKKQGANVVVPEEFETALRLVGLVMEAYGAAHRTILRELDRIREENYALLREGQAARVKRLSRILSAAGMEEIELGESAPVIGQTLRALDLRGRAGVLVVALHREPQLYTSPDPDLALAPGDTLVLFGEDPGIREAQDILLGPPSEPVP